RSNKPSSPRSDSNTTSLTAASASTTQRRHYWSLFKMKSMPSLEMLDSYMLQDPTDSIFLLDQSITSHLEDLKNQAIYLRYIQQRLREMPSDETNNKIRYQ